MIWILCFHRWQRTFHFFFIVIENFRGEGKILMRHTQWHNFFWKHSWFLQNLEESEQFFILFLKKMENLRRFFSIFEVRGGNLFLNVVWLKYDHFFFYCKTDNLSCLNKKNCLVNVKAKEIFMYFYVICMNKHVGITLLVFLLDSYVARTTPLFLTFCLQTYFQ